MLASLQCVDRDIAAAATQLLGAGGYRLGDDFVTWLLHDLSLAPSMVIVFDNFESMRGGALLAEIAAVIRHAHHIFISQ